MGPAPEGDLQHPGWSRRGNSSRTGRAFNLVVVAEPTRADDGRLHGPVVAHSSFHHFCDYNWDLTAGAPSFVR